MNSAQLLLLSSSRAGESDYLAPCLEPIANLCETRKVLFIPYAGVTMPYADYTAKVAAALKPRNIHVAGIEAAADPVRAIAEAEVIMVGGGNTFHLLQQLYHFNLIAPIQAAVSRGTPYIGWSAGSNIAGLSIRTTNDMPIIEPPSFAALKLVPFQLNPHYTDYQPPGFHGETRDQRLAEFMVLEPTTPVVAIPEGTALRISKQTMTYQGNTPGFVFLNGQKLKLSPQQDCSQWLKASN